RIVSNKATVSLFLASPPTNDDLAAAQTVSDADFPVKGTTFGASVEDGEQIDFVVGDAPFRAESTVWYRWTAPTSGTYGFGTGAGPLTRAVYSGPPSEANFGNLTLVAAPGGATSHFDAVQGSTYYVQVLTTLIGERDFQLDLAAPPPSRHTYVVTTVNDNVGDANCTVDSCTLRQAVNAANAGNGDDA